MRNQGVEVRNRGAEVRIRGAEVRNREGEVRIRGAYKRSGVWGNLHLDVTAAPDDVYTPEEGPYLIVGVALVAELHTSECTRGSVGEGEARGCRRREGRRSGVGRGRICCHTVRGDDPRSQGLIGVRELHKDLSD